MTVACVALGAAAAVSAAGAAYSATTSAEGAADAQATLQGGINRMEAFRSQVRKDNESYRNWKEQVTQKLVDETMAPQRESQAYKDASRRFNAATAATGSVRSGAAIAGQRDLALSEEDARFARTAGVAQLLGTDVARSENLSASLLGQENQLLGGKASAQQDEANAKAAGIENVAGTVSSTLSAGAGAYGAYQANKPAATPKMEQLPSNYGKINNQGFDTSGLSMGGNAYPTDGGSSSEMLGTSDPRKKWWGIQ